jgi:hypothetical protein
MRHAIPAAAFSALLAAGSAVASPPARHPAESSTPPSAASSPSAPQLAPADQKRAAAIQQYQHDLVNVVALRADPDYLLGAAILAKPFKGQAAGLDFDTLSRRAASATDAGPAIEWARLGACKTKADCPNANAFAYLRQHAAGNAAVWIVAMDVAAQNKDSKAERAAFEKAVDAQSYDDYYGKALAAVAKATAVLPPLPDTTQGAHAGQPDNPDGVRVLVSVINTQAYPRPEFGPLEHFCGKHAADKHAGLKTDCLKLAHTLQWGSSPLARAVGLHMQAELNPADKAQDDEASRNLAWQVRQYSGLLQRALVDPSLASRWLNTARNGGTELSLILATLRDHHIPVDAPASAGSTGK